MSTVLDRQLIEAYLATDYVVFTQPEISLRIGEPSEQLPLMMRESPNGGAAFITAYNPLGESVSDDLNCQANARLAQRLRDLGLSYFEGEGRGADGNWPPEPSFLALDLDRDLATELGREFRQNAIVWIGTDGVPELLLLR